MKTRRNWTVTTRNRMGINGRSHESGNLVNLRAKGRNLGGGTQRAPAYVPVSHDAGGCDPSQQTTASSSSRDEA